MANEECIKSLHKLGFTELEAEVYAVLLQKSAMTGYGVAQSIGKQAANIYKAIESLQNKGAIIVDEGSNRICRAIPADELLSRIEREFLENKQEAANSLAKIQDNSADNRVYQLRSREQIIERCRSMLLNCRQIALIDIFPVPFKELQADIEATAARGVEVLIKVYEPVEIESAEIFLDSFNQTVIDRWQGQWLNIVTDAAEHLLAFLTKDGKEVHQAIWSSSAYLSCVYHSSIGSELVLTGLLKRIEEGVSTKELAKIAKRYFEHTAPKSLGYQILLERFGETDPPG
jgi:sugar-specific transcriptional regulator TrmB